MSTNPPRYPLPLVARRPISPSTHQRSSRSPGLTTGSATQTLTNTTPQRSESPEPLILRLRGAHTPQSDSAEDSTNEGLQLAGRRRHIRWADDVIDNEGLGRKKSKVCCIYHKPRPVGESSDESSSDSSSDSDSGFEQDGARPVGGAGKKGRGRRPHGHSHDHDHVGSGDDCSGHSHGKRKQGRRPSPNAYEKMPKYDIKPLTRQPGNGR